MRFEIFGGYIMKTFGKLCLLLVVIGWFCPVACQLSGPQWIEAVINDGMGFEYAMCAIFLFGSMVIALIGIILFIVSSVKKVKSNDKNKTTVLSMIFGLPFLVVMVITSASLEVLNIGAYLMLAGWLLSLIFLKLGGEEKSINDNNLNQNTEEK